MKKARIIGACAFIYLFGIGFGAAVTGTPERAAAAVSYQAAAVSKADDEAYIIKERDGLVAVYSLPGGELAAETDISVSGLRAKDRALLAVGIEAENYNEVLLLLEDLGS